MKITIIYEKLKEGIKIVERLAQKSLTLPILQSVCLKTEKNFLCFSATNLEMGIKYWSLVKTEKGGQVAVPAKVFSQLVDLLPQKPISLEGKDDDLLISCQSHKSTIKGFSPDDFPIIPVVGEGESVAVSCRDFCQALSQVVDVASPSAARPEISGIYFVFQKDLIKMVATDSFRLGEQKLFLKNSLSQEYSLILPQQTAKEVINIFGQKEGVLKIYFSPNQVMFESLMPETSHPQIQLTSRLLDGSYPDYEAIIPEKTTTQIQAQKNDFLKQTKSASLFSGKNNEVSFAVNPTKGKISISSQDQDLGEYQSEVPAKIKGKAVNISFNHYFLNEGFLKIKNPEVVLELTNEDGAAVLKSAEAEGFLYIVMPIKK